MDKTFAFFDKSFAFMIFLLGVLTNAAFMLFVDIAQPPKCTVQASTVQPQKVICVLDQNTYIRLDATHGWSSDKGIYFYLDRLNSSDAQK
jgi:hypothetical protein